MTICDFCGTSLEKEVRDNRVNTVETKRFMPSMGSNIRTTKASLCNACMNEIEKSVTLKMRNFEAELQKMGENK